MTVSKKQAFFGIIAGVALMNGIFAATLIGAIGWNILAGYMAYESIMAGAEAKIMGA